MNADISKMTRGVHSLVTGCAGLAAHERALVLCQPQTVDVAGPVFAAAQAIAGESRLLIIEPPQMHGAEPPENAAEAMAQADVIFCLTAKSLAHTSARKAATDRGARFLSLPDYSIEQLESDSLGVDFESLVPGAEALARALNDAARIVIHTGAGRDRAELALNVANRRANCCPGLARQPGTLASPPDAEVSIPPWEDSAEGILWVNGSIPCRPLGQLAEPLGLVIERGKIVWFIGHAPTADAVTALLSGHSDAARVAAEFGIGLNPRARLCGRMLEDEGCLGTIHVGFGSNATIGGTNAVAFHLDFVTAGASVWADDVLLMDEGRHLVFTL
ncbi:MAG: hypothetical protein K8T25_22540 [Planctomycetia bacterium]|nr:hypothetical protein [Planctomycetia bacterium]